MDPYRAQSTVALSGESADEVFGGYAWFHEPESVNADVFAWMPERRCAWRGRRCSIPAWATGETGAEVHRPDMDFVLQLDTWLRGDGVSLEL